MTTYSERCHHWNRQKLPLCPSILVTFKIMLALFSVFQMQLLEFVELEKNNCFSIQFRWVNFEITDHLIFLHNMVHSLLRLWCDFESFRIFIITSGCSNNSILSKNSSTLLIYTRGQQNLNKKLLGNCSSYH